MYEAQREAIAAYEAADNSLQLNIDAVTKMEGPKGDKGDPELRRRRPLAQHEHLVRGDKESHGKWSLSK